MEKISIKQGVLKGVEKAGYTVFKGVPYAKPPVGGLRWRAPQPPEPWAGEYDAAEFKSICWQPGQELGSFYSKEFYENPDFMPPMDEDCLFLNVWTPAKAADEKLPVAFWIHGGAFMNGFGSELEFDGEAFCRNGVILVTINYRLGAFGFLCHPWLSAEDPRGSSGNYAILDQIAALQWVRENISAFGGDPDRITVFGQSAGSMSVQTLLSSPLTKGMMQGAVMQSASGYGSSFNRDVTMEEAAQRGRRFVGFCGADSLEALRALPAKDILRAFKRLLHDCTKNGKGLPFSPVIDGYVLTEGYDTVIEKGRLPDIPYMIGSTKHDIGLTKEQQAAGEKGMLYHGCINWSLQNAKQGKRPSYVYYFTRELLGDDAGAFHSAELWYVFHTLQRSWRPKTDGDYKLADEMNRCWCDFAKSGNPNGGGTGDWLPYTEETPFIKVFDAE